MPSLHYCSEGIFLLRNLAYYHLIYGRYMKRKLLKEKQIISIENEMICYI